MARDAEYPETLRALGKLTVASDWAALREQAVAAATAYPDSADVHSYVAHAMRQLGRLEEGYEWAVRAAKIDPTNLFAVNRVSLLANLTGRYDHAYAIVQPVLDVVVDNKQSAQNLAVAIVNAIYGASRIGKIPEAVELFTPIIVRLDHEDLHYNAACLYALAGDERWYVYMAKALAAKKAMSAFDDTDFDAVRGDPRFVALLARDWEAEAAALKRSHKKTREQLRPEDFVDPGQLALTASPSASGERNPELERSIAANRDDVDAHLVYSDWLQERSDPRGLFILASKRCEEARTEDERMLAYVEWAAFVHTHAGALLGPFAAHLDRSRATWHLGFIRELEFDLGYGNNDGDAGELLATTLALPVCGFLRTLAIGDIWATEELDYEPVVAVLRRVELPYLQGLAIEPNKFQLSWTHLDATGLAQRFPGLHSLVLGAGAITTGVLDFPQLRRFAIHTGGLTRKNLAAICGARWPELGTLEIWFGDTEYGADEFSAHDLESILAGRGTPKLRRLALQNADFTDALCAALVSARVMPRLRELDLSMGTMTDEGANVIVANAAHFAHLARLSVADNALSAEATAELQRVLPNVEIGTQKARRYVSVGE